MFALFVAFIGLLLAASLLALWRGGGPERAVAVMFALAWAVSVLTFKALQYQKPVWFILTVDTLLLLGLLLVMRRANRAWPVVVTSLQFLVVLGHAARAVNVHQLRFVYIVMTEFWPYLQLIVLLTGTILHWRRTATHGAEPSWKS